MIKLKNQKTGKIVCLTGFDVLPQDEYTVRIDAIVEKMGGWDVLREANRVVATYGYQEYIIKDRYGDSKIANTLPIGPPDKVIVEFI